MSEPTFSEFAAGLPIAPSVRTGCWNWRGTVSEYGYGKWTRRGGNYNRMAHRVVWESLNGLVPAGLELDHRCNNKLCVNPTHLAAVTHRENALRSNNVGGLNARKTHCGAGHPFNSANTRYEKKTAGHIARICRACHAQKLRDRRRKQS